MALLFAGAFAMFPKAVDVEFATATEGPIRVTVQEDGKTRIREKYTVSAPVSGRLSRIELHAGDKCDEKTLMAVILPGDPAILDARSRAEASARVQAAEAKLQRAESNAEQARLNHEFATTKYERVKKLISQDVATQDKYDAAKTEFLVSDQAVETATFETEIAKFELQLAKAAVKQFASENAETTVQPFEIHAPVSGRIIRVFEESSRVVTVGTPLLELGDPQHLEIEIDVLSTDAVRIKPGAAVTIEHWGGESPLQASVRVIEPGAFTKVSSLGVEEQRVNIIADFVEEPDRLASLGDGYRVEARITVEELAGALQIPNSALFRHQRKWHVLAIVNNVAVMRPVSIGLQNDWFSQITKGLAVGDKVVVYPSDDLSAGTKVSLVESTADIADDSKTNE